MSETIHVLAFAGSLRRASNHAGLLRAAQDMLPPGMTLEIFDLSAIPLYNEDLVDKSVQPEAVRRFKERIAGADALLIASPEYNASIPGVLKNALDWASRPIKDSPLSGKPVAILGAGGKMGTSRMQAHFRQVALATNMLPVNRPEVAIQFAWEKFDAQGNLTDEAACREVHALLEALYAWTLRLSS